MEKKYLVIFITLVCSAFVLKAQCTFTTAVPYFESFAGVILPNQLPTCWTASNLGSTCLTYTSAQTQGRVARTGNEYAYFNSSFVGANYFYSNGIFLNTGQTYSTSVWFQTEYFGHTNWSDLSILIGPNQNTLNLVQVASTNTTAVANIYKSVSNTFTVATSGIYYAAIRATSSSSIGAQYLTFDDFYIDLACIMNLAVSSNSICAGQSVSLTISGADTYTWNTGATSQSIVETPTSSTTYSVVGTNILSGCTANSSVFITVNPVPNVVVYTSSPFICLGSPINITAFGASSYSWSSGQQTNSITVSPTLSASYTVTGSDNFGCTSSAVQFIQVNPLPIVVAAASATYACAGDSVTLYASGATSYQWTGMNSGTIVSVFPTTTSVYTVTGIDAQNCSNSATVQVQVSECTGISSLTNSEKEIKLAPNPFSNELVIFTGNTNQKTIEISDLNGRMILQLKSKEEQILLNTTNFAKGIYYVKVLSGERVKVEKMVKH